MPNQNNYINWKATRGKEGGISFQRIHIKPGLYFHRIFQHNTGSNVEYTHTSTKVNDAYFDMDNNSHYFGINNNGDDAYVPDDSYNPYTEDDKSTVTGKFAMVGGEDTIYGIGSFKIVEVKSDDGRPFDFD